MRIQKYVRVAQSQIDFFLKLDSSFYRNMCVEDMRTILEVFGRCSPNLNSVMIVMEIYKGIA